MLLDNKAQQLILVRVSDDKQLEDLELVSIRGITVKIASSACTAHCGAANLSAVGGGCWNTVIAA